VAQCAFEYDAAQLVAEIQHAAMGLSRTHGERIGQIALKHEAKIREAAESVWWDELQEQASTRLVGVAGDQLRQVMNRGGVQARVVLSIDAVGPRTAASTVVSADGRILHCEDLPCQLSAPLRAQAVTRMGELIHTYGIDLIVISNGPARRASMVAVGDLLAQSPEKSLRWTLAERSGADVYAGSLTADQEMRTTPRRFRAAAWLAFSVLRPSHAISKIDPLKLRLVSFQRELADEALSETLNDIMASGASRGGIDVNAAPISWLTRLPGVTQEVAEAIDSHRRKQLFHSRSELRDAITWPSPVHMRQALPFLRVFASSEVLDGTLVHPDDYSLAKKLATALAIELPPATPPGYQLPTFEADEKATPIPVVVEAVATESIVEEIAGDQGGEFAAAALVEPSAEADAVAEETVALPSTISDSVEANTDESNAAEDSTASESAAKETESATDTTGTKPVADLPLVKHPLPERAKVDKLIKEWQIGSRRAHQIVNWLCDPFGDSDAGGEPPGVLTSMPSLASLKPGDQVIGIVVGVMPFGVFVELAPDCSGLIHVSKVSEAFVEDLHEAVQVGDVITTWVSRIDDKRRRVALSAISPQREAELQQKSLQRDVHSRDRGPRPPRGDRPRNAGRPSSPPANVGVRAGQQNENRGARGEQARGDQTRGDRQPRGDHAGQVDRGGRGDRAPRSQDRGSRGGDRPPRGDRPPNDRGGRFDGTRREGGQDQRRSRDQRDDRGSRPRKLESYRVESSEPPAAPISEAMEKGVEPLRSFGDLLQFYSKKEPAPTKSASALTESAKTTPVQPPEKQSIAPETIEAEPTNVGNSDRDAVAEHQPQGEDASAS
jgi:transcriptional accessory protein Tex/SPT6